MASGLIAPAVAGTVEALGMALDKLFTSDDERAKAQILVEKLRQQPHILQAEINKVEAQHRTVFVAGWRPFIGWVCGTALAWHFIGYDLASWIATALGMSKDNLPKLENTDELFPLILALLGLGGMRTFEKFRGVTR